MVLKISVPWSSGKYNVTTSEFREINMIIVLIKSCAWSYCVTCHYILIACILISEAMQFRQFGGKILYLYT